MTVLLPRRMSAPGRDVARRAAISGRSAANLLLIGGALVMIFPFVWMLLTSFKGLTESNRFPPTVIPHVWRWQNYVDAWNAPPSTLGRYLLNSTIIAGVGTMGQLLVCSLAAYAFARLVFRGKGIFFLLVLATAMVPGEVTLIPNFVTINHMPFFGGNTALGEGGHGLYDTYSAMILPGLAGAFNIFLLRQTFLQIPNDLWEASQLDGSGSWQYFWRVVLPLSMPGLITVGIFGFISRWNGLLWPLIVTSSESIRPVQLAMTYYQTEFLTNYGLVMAASVVATLPVVVLFLIVQRQFIEGIGTTGLKG